MIDLEADRSLVRKLLAQGFDVIYATGDTIIPVSCRRMCGNTSVPTTTPKWRC